MPVRHSILLGSLLGGLLALAGCSPSNTTANLPTVSAATLNSVQVVVDAPAGAQSLGTVRTTRCRNSLSEDPPAEQTIIDGMKAEAASRGANAIRVINYRMGLTAWNACYHTMTGRAEMYRL